MAFKCLQVQEVADGNKDHKKILEAIEKAQKNTSQPSLIIVETTIGFGSSMQGTEKGKPISVWERRASWGKVTQRKRIRGKI